MVIHVPHPDAFVAFPPGRGNILVPLAPAVATTVGMSMYTACKPGARFAQWSLWAAVTVTRSARVLPGARASWPSPLPDEILRDFVVEWENVLGRRIDGIALYRRIQPERPASTLLACAAGKSMLVRIAQDSASLDREKLVSSAMAGMTAKTFRVPRLLATGDAGDWHWAGYEAMSSRPHHPVMRLPKNIESDIAALVATVIDRPRWVPPHWAPAHGDLSPWNIRRSRGQTWLIDWEDSAWLPPGADLVYFNAVRRALRFGSVPPLAVPDEFAEARSYWAQAVRNRDPYNTDPVLNRRLQELLPL